MRRRGARAVAAGLAVAAVAALYAGTYSHRDISDTVLNSLQTRALVLHGDVDVSRYDVPSFAFAFEREGRLYSVYGVGASVVAAPAYAVVSRLDVSEGVREASAVIPFAALAVVAMLLVLLRLAPRLAVPGAAVFGFGTTLWPVATMAFYQHASVAFFHVLGLAGFLSRGRRGPLLAGLCFGSAAFVRLPAAVPLAVIGLFYLTQGRRAVAWYVLGAAAPVAGIVIQNRWIWGTWLTGGYSQAGIGFQGNVRAGLWGLLFSWWRGLLVYSPVLGLGAIGWVLAVRRKGFLERRLAVLGASCVVTILFYARWTTWHGGLNQFGYRYLLDIVPFLVVLAVHAVDRLPRLRALAFGLALLSIVTMSFGAGPDEHGFDFTFFETRFEKASIGQAWLVGVQRPLGSVLRLAGVAAVTALLWAAARRPAPEEPAGGEPAA